MSDFFEPRLRRNEAGELVVEVIAQAAGFFQFLRKPGDVFDMGTSAMKRPPADPEVETGEIVYGPDRKDALPEMWVLPSWVAIPTAEVRAAIAAAPGIEREKFAAAVLASSGSKGNKGKRTFLDFIRAGDKASLPRAAQGAIDSATPKAAADAKRKEIEALQPADLPIIEKDNEDIV